MWGIAGCQTIGDDVNATLAAGDSLVSTEAANLANAASISRTEMAATLANVQTREAEVRSVNNQLIATMAAVATPTPALIAGQADPITSMGEADMMMDGEFIAQDTLLVTTGVSDTVADADGCVVNPRSQFPSSTSQLFATMRVFNLVEGTPLRAEWYYEGELRIADDWNLDIFSNDRCLWFNLEANRTDFTPGEWQVILFVGEERRAIDAPMTFLITDGA